MKTRTCPSAIEPLEIRIAPALITTLTWQGDLGTNGWDDGTLNTNTNWISNLGLHKVPLDGNALVFPSGAGQKANVNDLTGLDLRSILLGDGGYSITGNAITLSAGLTGNFASGSSTFNPAITLRADQTFSSAAGSLLLGAVDLGGHALTIDNAGLIVFSSNASQISGAGSIVKKGAGVARFDSTASFAGPVQVNAGTLRANGVNTLGATGPGNGTTIASGATVELFSGVSGGIFAEDFTVGGTGAPGKDGALIVEVLGILVNPSVTLSGALRLSSDATLDFNGGSGSSTITFSGAIGAADDALATLTLNLPVNSTAAFANTATFTTELAGPTPGAGGHDQLKVLGPVDLGGATLNVVPSFTPAVGAKFVIVDNDGTEAITGTFNGLAEGAAFTAGGVNFTISYKGTDATTGNDAVLTVASLVSPPLSVALSTDGKTATYTDVDGDLVTVKTTKGPFQQSDFTAIATGVAGGGQLQQINLTTHPADFAGAGLTITAKPGPLGGNGFVNVGYINATGVDLGVVKIGGDLGRINAGTVGGDVKIPALKSLTVESLGLLGKSTQASGGNLKSLIAGAVPKLTVKGDYRATITITGAIDGKLGSATIGGSMVNDQGTTNAVQLTAQAGLGALKIAGDVRVESGNGIVIASSDGAIGSIAVGGSLVATETSFGVFIEGFGQSTAPTKGTDLAIGSIKVGGSVEFASILAGEDAGGGAGANADASIGSITVGGDWIASSVRAGVSAGFDFFPGNNDDAKFAGGVTRDNPALFSTIGSFTVKGQAFGTALTTTDMFGVGAERIGKAKVGEHAFAFTNGATPEAFFAAPTLSGRGVENPAFDFTIRELGSTTPTIAPVGGSVALSTDGKIATFTDVDGDFVTVKRSVGTFVQGDFGVITAGLGGQFRQLTISPAPNNALVSFSITAKPGPAGGNGFVNVGQIIANQTDLGTVFIDGELQDLDAGDSGASRQGLGSLAVHSLGALGGTSPNGDEINGAHGIGKILVQTDVRTFHIFANGSNDGTLASLTVGGSMSTAEVQASVNIGKIAIGGSYRGDSRIQATGRIGTITVGGDFAGTGSGATIEAFAQSPGPATGLDVALKSLTVKGSVLKTNVILGRNNNADASLGAISVGRAWLASSVLAGTTAGQDTFIGTSDDAKVTLGGPIDVSGRLSTIASIVIKGQAFGTAAAGDSFGIVAEQIIKAKIGTRTLAFHKGGRDAADAFAAAPTTPGVGGLTSDFFLREATL